MNTEMVKNSVSYASRYGTMRTLDFETDYSTMNVYCPCGRIVVLDRSEMYVRLGLGKELECTDCRNQRISREIDSLNDHYDGISEPFDMTV